MSEWEGWQTDIYQKTSVHKHCAEAMRIMREAIVELRTAVETIWHERDELLSELEDLRESVFKKPWH